MRLQYCDTHTPPTFWLDPGNACPRGLVDTSDLQEECLGYMGGGG